MNTSYGFSLTEVMVSLLLMTSTSLALIKQQWQTTQLFNQMQSGIQLLNQSDNVAEKSLTVQQVNLCQLIRR